MNLKTNNYLEIEKIYTLGAYYKKKNPTLYVDQKSDYKDEKYFPNLFLRGLKNRGETYYQIAPGSN